MNILTLKGFVYGVKWTEEQIDKYTEMISKYDIIVWDGDLYKNDSFTYILHNVMNKYPNKQYIAHKKTKSVYKLDKNYTEDDHGVPSYGFNCKNLLIHELENELEWNELGVKGLEWVVENYPNSKKDVLFLGMGEFAKKESEIMKNMKHITIISENISRK